MIRDVLAPNPGPFTLYGTRTWLLDENVMVDPGPLIDSHVDALVAAQPAVDTILVTHRHGDHAPAAIPVSERTGARIYAPTSVLDDRHVHQRLVDGDEVAGVRVIATPGHTAEHVCFLTGDQELFSGDMILGEGTTAIFPPDGNMRDYLASLERLRALEPRRIFPAHGPVRDDAIEWIDYYIEHRRMRETQIGEALAGGSKNLEALRGAIYPDLHRTLHQAAEGQLLAHLVHMSSDGRIEWDGSVARIVS